MSRLASIITPVAGHFSTAFSSCISATSKMYSKSSSIPVFCSADTGTQIVSPPHFSGIRPCSVICCRTLSGSASGLSILFTATIIGTFADLAWFIASIVWGITPSSAATTSIAISVDCAPRALIWVKASCPGVSMKTIFLSSNHTVYAPILWVIPPTSVDTILCFEARIESKSVVLPWSTCPIIVTTGARLTSIFSSAFRRYLFFSSFIVSSSINASRSSSKTSISKFCAAFLAVSTSIGELTVTIIPCIIKNLMISAGVFLILSDNSPTVIGLLITTDLTSSTACVSWTCFLCFDWTAFSRLILSCSSSLLL